MEVMKMKWKYKKRKHVKYGGKRLEDLGSL